LLNRTPFYAESGGQIADTGILTNGKDEIRITDVQKSRDQYVHYADSLPDDLTGIWTAKIDIPRRIEIQKHHSATHLLHAALREILGDHVAQKGSLVADTHLRFDFSHFEAMTENQLTDVEVMVNKKIQENIRLQED